MLSLVEFDFPLKQLSTDSLHVQHVAQTLAFHIARMRWGAAYARMLLMDADEYLVIGCGSLRDFVAQAPPQAWITVPSVWASVERNAGDTLEDTNASFVLTSEWYRGDAAAVRAIHTGATAYFGRGKHLAPRLQHPLQMVEFNMHSVHVTPRCFSGNASGAYFLHFANLDTAMTDDEQGEDRWYKMRTAHRVKASMTGPTLSTAILRRAGEREGSSPCPAAQMLAVCPNNGVGRL